MKINFATPQLHQVCTSDKLAFGAITKLKQDLAAGRDANTPGPNTLKLNGAIVAAKHFHITNQIGMAYNFSNQVLTILALGKKHNRNTGRGDSGYDWDQKGAV